MLSESPFITVLMPVYNCANYITKSIESVLNQTYEKFELLIINDGSTDGTIEQLKFYEAKDNRIRIYHQKNQGIVSALNKGINLAKGKYIARIDADDIMNKKRLSEQINILELKDNIAVLGSWITVINEKGESINNWELPFQPIEFDFWTYLNGDVRVGHPCVTYRTDVVRFLGGYRDNYPHAEDIDLWFRIEQSGFEILNIPKYLTLYRKHNSQITNKYRELSTQSYHKALSDFLSNRLKCDIDSEKAALFIPSNYTNIYFNNQDKIDLLYNLKYQMFRIFVVKNNLTKLEVIKYAYKLWLSLFPVCRLQVAKFHKTIIQNTTLSFKLILRSF